MIQLEIENRGGSRTHADYRVYLYMPEPGGTKIISHSAMVTHFDRSRGVAELLREAADAIERRL